MKKSRLSFSPALKFDFFTSKMDNFMPQKNEKDSMFYLTVDRLINAVNDANSRDLHGAEHLKKAIALAESVNPEKEAVFLLQDEKDIQLFHFKTDEENSSLLQM